MGREQVWGDRLLPYPVSDLKRIFCILSEECWKGRVTQGLVLPGIRGRCQPYIFWDKWEQHMKSLLEDIRQEISYDASREGYLGNLWHASQKRFVGRKSLNWTT